jgi:hypothetical protein
LLVSDSAFQVLPAQAPPSSHRRKTGHCDYRAAPVSFGVSGSAPHSLQLPS